jgi:hypothetical protein
LKCSEKSANAFFARRLAGYDIGSVPRFETTSAAVYGRLTLAKRGFYKGVTRVNIIEKKTKKQTSHQRSTSETSVRNAVFSVDMAVGEGGLED